MGPSRTLVTGAGGFIGQAVARRLLATLGPEDSLVLADWRAGAAPADPRVRWLSGDLAHADVLDVALEGATRVVHLAAVPGGAAEADYALSRQVNLEATLALLDRLAASPAPVRLVYASSIAVFGSAWPEAVDDDTPPRPDSTYGAHKLMVEISLANLNRLGQLDAVALRLPGVVARPSQGAGGLKSAFMSELFEALRRDRPFTCPVGPHATVWLMSARQAADNLALALDRPAAGPAVTLPAIRCTLAELTAMIASALAGSAPRIDYQPDASLEAGFGRLPPLSAARASGLGFNSDGDLETLVDRALQDLAAAESTP